MTNRTEADVAKRDFYETLGVAKSATEAELKAAFRKAAMQCHPDRHPGDHQAEARFKELNEAYQALSDGNKRAAYDRYGHAAFEQNGAGMGDGNAHATDPLPLVAVGGLAGPGHRHLLQNPKTPVANLWLGVADKFGVNIDHLGNSDGVISL